MSSTDTRNLTSGILEVKCEMPPGENNSVPLQLQWGEYYSPVYEISYRPPTILRFKLGNTTNTSTDQYLATSLSEEEKEVCLRDETAKFFQCSCKMDAKICDDTNRCVYANSSAAYRY